MLVNRLGAPSEPRPQKRARFALLKQLTRLAAALDKSGKPDAPISIPASFVDLCRLGLRPGTEPRSFLFGRHVVKACW